MPLLLVVAAMACLGVPLEAQTEEELRVLIRQGTDALASGDLEQARAAFQELTQKAPESAPGWMGLTSVHERAGDLPAALEAARRARELAPTNPGAAFALGRVHARMGDLEGAQSELGSARELGFQGPAPTLLEAFLLRDRGQPDEAIALLRGSLENDGRDAEVATQLSLLELARGNVEDAISAGELARQADAAHAGARVALGLALAQSDERRTEAASLLEQAAEDDPSDARVAIALAEVYIAGYDNDRARKLLDELSLSDLPPSLLYRLGNARRRVGDATGAERALDRFEELSQRDRDAASSVRDYAADFNEAQRLASTNDLQGAIELLDELVARLPEDARAQSLRAKVLFSMRRVDEAIQAIGKASELAPNEVEPRYLWALFAMAAGDAKTARAHVDLALILAPDLAAAHALLGTIEASEENFETAAVAYERAIELGLGNSSDVRLRYARVLESLGRLQERDQQIEELQRLSQRESGN